jgi:ribonuclease HI
MTDPTAPPDGALRRDRVVIYTDGAAEPNPGPGGYGIVLMAGKHRKEISGGFRKTTNNRMELMGVIVALESLTRPCDVLLYSDSKYVVDSITRGSVLNWKRKNWYRTSTQRAKNADLWQRYLDAAAKHRVEFRWVKGHAGIAENERCDVLAVAAIQSPDLADDPGFDDPLPNGPGTAPASLLPSHQIDTSIKHEQAGEPCRKCGTPLVQKPTKKQAPRPGQTYCYDWYLSCPGCNTIYMVDAAKRKL